MSIREKTEWDGTKMHEFVDMDTNIYTENDNSVHVKNPVVFMAVGINGHWKMPIGYFLVAGLSGTERSKLLKQCLILMSDTGAKVHSITFDGAYSNGKMCSIFGALFNINNESSFLLLKIILNNIILNYFILKSVTFKKKNA